MDFTSAWAYNVTLDPIETDLSVILVFDVTCDEMARLAKITVIFGKKKCDACLLYLLNLHYILSPALKVVELFLQ